ncbi:MAG: DUF1893 domain-containing protein [Rikenellaceae bacterium]|nr:DUF1893 domain-containing protein [Rikenellaceae bacterium]
MKAIIEQLHADRCSCVIRNGETRSFHRPGVADLYELLNNEPDFLRGASVADKVVGKGAAALMVLGQIREVYTDVISRPALELLAGARIGILHKKEVVPAIRNRIDTGPCPLESRCLEENDPEKLLLIIEQFIAGLSGSRPTV